MHTILKLAIFGISGFIVLQLIRPGIPSGASTAELQTPEPVKHVFEKNCYDCHSDRTRLAWFDEVVPAYWLVRRDILTARRHLNFSTLASKPPAVQKATLYEAVNMIQLGAMPLPSYRKLHPDANVTAAELTILKNYLSPWPAFASQPPAKDARLPAGATRPEFNGLSFDPGYTSWKAISFTDRGDNNTLRFVLGNEVAIQAAESGKISPWPDGTRFAKIAWLKETGPDGLVRPGEFYQVELMEKDSRRYRDTEGWAWGRWRGLELNPYGQDARFVDECTSCHLPLRGNDYVYTLPVTPASVNGREIVNNRATLPAVLPYQPLHWRAITMYVDSRNHTMATLFGNDVASATAYPAGTVLALVTWAQREDPHWFGARIPDKPVSVEFLKFGAAGQANDYLRFAGPDLVRTPDEGSMAADRTRLILALPPAKLP